MKGAVRLLILFICFITIQSDAQRGWRFLDPMIFPTPRSSQTPYYESRDGTLWAVGGGLWRNDGSGWQQETQFEGEQITTIYESRDGTLWAAGYDSVWGYDQVYL